MKKKFELIISYLSKELNNEKPFSISFPGTDEVQFPADNGGFTNYVFTKDELTIAIKNIIKEYMADEKIKWNKAGKPENHVYNDLVLLNILIE